MSNEPLMVKIIPTIIKLNQGPGEAISKMGPPPPKKKKYKWLVDKLININQY